MRTLKERIVFQEVPNEVSLLFQITGCQVRCSGCHSPHLWNNKNGIVLTNEYLKNCLIKYKGLVTCVLFFGGEWEEKELINKLIIAKSENLKTCLYSGEEIVSKSILKELDFVKLGKWITDYGGLGKPSTNQVFRDLNTGKSLNHLFERKTHIK